MAKINHILFGQGKGKVGGLVLQRYEGMNVVREKPISVKNPQTKSQSTQRAKLKNASQIVAQFKEVFNTRLLKLSIYERTRRASAVSEIIKVMTTNTNPESVSALVIAVVDAINAKSVSPLPAPTITLNNDNYEITAPNGDIVVYDVCGYNEDGVLIRKESETYTSTGSAKQVPADPTSFTEKLMAVSYHALTEEGRAILSNAENNTGDAWVVTIERGVTAGDIEVSNIGFSA